MKKIFYSGLLFIAFATTAIAQVGVQFPVLEGETLDDQKKLFLMIPRENLQYWAWHILRIQKPTYLPG